MSADNRGATEEDFARPLGWITLKGLLRDAVDDVLQWRELHKDSDAPPFPEDDYDQIVESVMAVLTDSRFIGTVLGYCEARRTVVRGVHHLEGGSHRENVAWWRLLKDGA